MQVETIPHTSRRRVIWDGSALSNQLDVREINGHLLLELPAEFQGSTVTYYSVNASGVPLALLKGGSAVTDTVTESALHVLSADLVGIDTLILESNQTETCAGELRGSA